MSVKVSKLMHKVLPSLLTLTNCYSLARIITTYRWNNQLNGSTKVFSFSSFFFGVLKFRNKIRYFLLLSILTYTCAAYNKQKLQCWNQYKWNATKYFRYMFLFLHLQKQNIVTGTLTNLCEGSTNTASVFYIYWQWIF